MTPTRIRARTGTPTGRWFEWSAVWFPWWFGHRQSEPVHPVMGIGERSFPLAIDQSVFHSSVRPHRPLGIEEMSGACSRSGEIGAVEAGIVNAR